jgi:penicillin-binding protein 2
MATANEQRLLRIEAPRGAILDRSGRTLVSNKAATSIQVWPADLPKRRTERRTVLRRLATVVGTRPAAIEEQMRHSQRDPLTPIVVSSAATPAQVAYLLERQGSYPGVRLVDSYIRRYPRQSLAAHVLGYVGEISPEQLKRQGQGPYLPGDLVGQAGAEASYDRFLRGRDGTAVLRVDANGRPRGTIRLQTAPVLGNAVRLTLDLRLQQAAERALRLGIDTARANKNWYANGGAIVAMDPRDGSILAVASNPTYQPRIYAGRVKPRELTPLTEPRAAAAANYPILDRGLAGLYPPGSTFKPVTALAAMQEHLLAPYSPLPCTGSVTIAKQIFRNWNPAMNGTMTLPTALAASCDTYFYRLGYDFYLLPKERGQPLQRWAAHFGFGQATGIDVGHEERGLLPTIAWRQRTYTKRSDPCCWQVDRLWKPGDSIQLAIGQKDLLVTPLQMTRFYAMLGNGGRLVLPHVLADVEQAGNKGLPGRILLTHTTPPPVASGVDPAALAVVRQGLLAAAHASYGTSSGIFGRFPVAVAGKTGTAEKAVQIGGSSRLLSQSWWCGYAPADKPTIALCAVIENGGFGAEAAAPAALAVLQSYFNVKAVAQSYVSSD